jgi:Tol biopolymer transport system component
MLVSPLGGQERKLTDVAAGLSTLSWTPDGKWLAYSDADLQTGHLGIWAINVETGERRRLTTFVTESPGADARLGDYHPSLSPDGRTLAFARSTKHRALELYSVRLTRDLRPIGAPARITDHRYFGLSGIAWTADGSEVVYSAWQFGASELWRVPVSGGRDPRRLAFALPSCGSPAIARSRSRLVYSWTQSNVGLSRMEIGSKERKTLISSTRVNDLPQYSPDGRKIAFYSTRNWTMHVWTCDAEGANCQQLTSPGGPICWTPRWAPDGQWLALECFADGNPEIYLIASDGGPLRRVTDNAANDLIPSWSRDGRWIYFTSDRSGEYELWKVPKEGGPAVQVTRSGGFAAFESMDGRQIYYTKWALDWYSGLFSMPVEGGEETEVLPKVGNHVFAVTSKGLYFLGDKSIQFFDPTSRRMNALEVRGVYFTISPDDKYVVWTRGENVTQDLMLVEGFR